MDEEVMDVWWYYNKRWSETGGIYRTKERCIEAARKEGFSCGRDFVESYKDHFVRIKKVKLHGEISDTLYVLRYPNAVYSDQIEAIKTGIEHVAHEAPYFCWSGANDWERRTRTRCDRTWMEKVSGGSSLDWEKIWEERVEGDQWTDPNHIEVTEKVHL